MVARLSLGRGLYGKGRRAGDDAGTEVAQRKRTRRNGAGVGPRLGAGMQSFGSVWLGIGWETLGESRKGLTVCGKVGP